MLYYPETRLVQPVKAAASETMRLQKLTQSQQKGIRLLISCPHRYRQSERIVSKIISTFLVMKMKMIFSVTPVAT